MECRSIQEQLSSYLEGDMNPEVRARFDMHLKDCRECSQALAELKSTVEHLANLGELDPPYWLAGRIMSRIREEEAREKGLFRRFFAPLHVRVSAGAVAAVAVAVTSIYIFRAIQPELLNPVPPSGVVSVQPGLQKEQPVQQQPGTSEKSSEARPVKPQSAPSPQDTLAGKLAGQGTGPAEIRRQSDEDKKPYSAAEGKGSSFQRAEEGQAKDHPSTLAEKQEMHKSMAPAPQPGQQEPARLKSARDEAPASAARAAPAKEEAAAKRTREQRTVSYEKKILERFPDGSAQVVVTYETAGSQRYKVIEERFDENGRRHGLQQEFYQSGRVKAEAEYNQGRLVWYREYAEDGVLKKERSEMDWLWLKPH